MTVSREGQLWEDLELVVGSSPERVLILVVGPPLEFHPYPSSPLVVELRHPVIVLDRGTTETWYAYDWECDSCMRRIL